MRAIAGYARLRLHAARARRGSAGMRNRQLALELPGDRQKWTIINPQLDRIVQKMLAPDPQARWRNMDEVVTQLKSVEGEASYMKWIDGDPKFFEEFYELTQVPDYLRQPGAHA
jgi:hypothetical protein